MTVNAITDTKKGEQGLRLLIFILPHFIQQKHHVIYYRTILTILYYHTFDNAYSHYTKKTGNTRSN